MYRKAIGAIVLDVNDNIILFQRRDYPKSWQGPEGGIEDGESPTDALYRELYEEVGIGKDEFHIVDETKCFIRYYIPDPNYELRYGLKGQEKKFFLIKLNNNFSKFKFDNKPEEIEFLDSKVVRRDDILSLIPYLKKNLYKKVLEEFKI